jgi:carbonic anhydrase
MNANSWSPTWRTKSSGMSRNGGRPDLVAGAFGIDAADLPGKAVGDPRAAVAVAEIKANPFRPAGFIVSSLVYDVRTGLVETVVAPSQLEDAA